MDTNIKAFLDMLSISEGTFGIGDDGYNVIVGSTKKHPNLFVDYSTHPGVLVDLGGGLKSTAAGRYQLLKRYYDAYKKSLGLPDFSPRSQDAIAIQQIKERRAIDSIKLGYFEEAVKKCCNIWASLPGAGYGQHENKMELLRGHFISQGGVVA